MQGPIFKCFQEKPVRGFKEPVQEEWERTLRHHLEHTLPKRCPRHLNFIREWLTWLQSYKRPRRTSTLYRYVEAAGLLLQFLEKRGKRVEEISFKDIEEWLNGLKVTDYRKPLAVVKLILKYLYLKTDKTRYLKLYEKFKISSIEPKPPEVLPRPVILRILEQMPLKWKAFYSLMYETGCRVSEARALKIKNLELLPDGSWKVFFPESKSAERTVLIVEFADILRKWLEEHPARDDPEAFVFYGKYPYKMVTRSRVVYALRKAAKQAGVNTHVYPHLLRHSRATELYGKLSEKEMMLWFGWRKRDMIDVYARVKMEEVHAKYMALYNRAPEPSEKPLHTRIVLCPYCNARNSEIALFCWKCGRSLKHPAEPSLPATDNEVLRILEMLARKLEEDPDFLGKILRRKR